MNNDNNHSPRERFERKQPTAAELAANLAQFTGTTAYYRYWQGITLITDGIKYLAEQTDGYWLLDIIGSYQPELARHADYRLQEMQFWTFTVNPDQSGQLICRADSNESPAVKHEILWTDFPLPGIQIWIGVEEKERIALLPSEY